jgi:Putative addiction module component
MAYDIKELLALPNDKREEIAYTLFESLEEQSVEQMPDWKIKMLVTRIEADKKNPQDGIEWSELRKKYLRP